MFESSHLDRTVSAGGTVLFLMPFIMERLAVKSSMAKSIGHDPFQSILEIEFTSGEIWQFYKVPHDVYKEMLTFSIGKYFQAFVRDNYEAKRVK